MKECMTIIYLCAPFSQHIFIGASHCGGLSRSKGEEGSISPALMEIIV